MQTDETAGGRERTGTRQTAERRVGQGMERSVTRMWVVLSLIGIGMVALSSCSGSKELYPAQDLGNSTCYNRPDRSYTVEAVPKKLDPNSMDTVLTRNFTMDALNVANAIGAVDDLQEYGRKKAAYAGNPTLGNRLEMLELRQAILQRIAVSSLEISSVTSELDCEEERASQISNFLKSKADNREKNLVIGSIVVGAAGAITVEGLNNGRSTGNAGSYVAVGTALAEATLGVLMLVNSKKVTFLHERNTIGEIWTDAPTSKTLPPSIWYYLNYKDGQIRKQSLRDLLVEHWKSYGQVGNEEDKEADTIYFGTGGRYKSDELRNRADMYDQIEAYISLMKQDLEVLSYEFEKF